MQGSVIMDEAIDYNALSWVRQELDETLKQARVQLEAYAADADNKALLQNCAAQLHEALGPLQMVGIKGAVLLTSEMEEVIADFLQDSVEEKETALELLMQAFLQMPDYLSSIRSGRKDNPAVLLPVINSLRATRGVQPLQETAVFSPNLSVRVPVSVFDVRAKKEQQDIQAMARAARVRFQSGLLAWYRGTDGNAGLQTLMDVLVELQNAALSEPVARVWWIGAGVAEALRDGELEESTDIKQLFGQLDRQVKRLMGSGEKVFSDLLSDDLVKNMLYRISQCASTSSRRITAIKSTYGLQDNSADGEVDGLTSEASIVFNDDLLQTVAVTIRLDIENIKNQLESFSRSGNQKLQELAPVTDGLHMLGNTLDMISKESLSKTVFAHEVRLRDLLAGSEESQETLFSAIANTLIDIENALADVAANDAENAVFSQGAEAVSREIVASMSRAKELITDFLQESVDFDSLGGVPDLLGQMSGGLQLIDEERAAVVTQKVSMFVSQVLIKERKSLSAAQLDLLADAICSIEFHVEETCENRGNTGAALNIAEQSMKQLGYPCPVTEQTACEDSPDNKHEFMPAMEVESCAQPHTNPEVAGTMSTGAVDNAPDITAMQIIAADVDEEILSIFIEEAGEELAKLKALVPAWVSCPDLQEYLEDARRSFHTLKGSGRMVGALAVGEFAWAFEGLANKIVEGVVTPHDDIRALIAQSPDALSALVEQIKGWTGGFEQDINYMAHCALVFSDPDGVPKALPVGEEVNQVVLVEQDDADSCMGAPDDTEAQACDLPVLSTDADPEIVEIFLEEAAEEVSRVAVAIPEWVSQPDNEEILATVRRSMHTLKGSGRMAGAMLIGEFSWSIENLVNKVVEGVVNGDNAVFALLGQVPEALQQLVTQVQDGTVPAADFNAIMQHADALSRGEVIAFSTAKVYETVDAQPDIAVEVVDEIDVDDTSDTDDAVLIDIFRNECFGHLQAIEQYLAAGDEPRPASEALYRALHTLSGISESAGVDSICVLAADLNCYVDEVFHSQQVLEREALDVLRDGEMELRQLVEKLPDQEFDAASQGTLRERIAGLPRTAAEPESVAAVMDAPVVQQIEELTEATDTAPASNDEDPYASMDQELYEIFIEEASEIIDNSESILRAWSEDRDNSEYMSEFQRHLHTLKGSARMMDILAIGDLAHVLESLLTRVADGQVARSDELFTLLNESYDRLSEMLENIKARRHPGDAVTLGTALQAMTEDGVVDSGGSEEIVVEAVTDDVASDVVDAVAAEDTSEVVADNDPESTIEVSLESEAVVDATPECTDKFNSFIESEPVATTAPAVVEAAESDLEEVLAESDSVAKPATETHAAPVPPVVRKAALLSEKPRPRKAAQIRSEQVRVQSDLLDELVNYGGEISIYRARMEKQVSDYRFNLTELDQTITRLRDQLRQLEIETEAQILFRHEQEVDSGNQDFDPLEMDRYSNLQQTSRSLIESISDLRSLQELMEVTTRESETLLLQQSRVNTDLQEGLMRTRMIPFSGLGSRLRRIVRQSASQLGKKVELELAGADGEMDRTVIERIIAPLEHMLRNAIAHGVELPAQRKESGKQQAGLITISFEREGPEIVLRIEDDGAGINVEAVRARAIERNLMLADSQLADIDIIQFILQTGFSTATEVTQISGRGVGMDVVNSEVKQLGGSLHIESTTGLGTQFTVRLPYTLAINQALLVTAGEQDFCVPLGSVEGVVRANPEELMVSYNTEECVYEYAGNVYQLTHLGTVLETGNMDLNKSQGQVPVLLVRIGEKRIALQVESLRGSREIVIKPVGVQLSTVSSISGATILGDGSVVMILDMAAVSRINTRMQPMDLPVRIDTENRLVVMVVDDSITVRKVTTRLLERNGFKVLTAKDGVDAMGQLQETLPDMMLLDIEMPRMDGFELATHMRNDERLKHVPIIMITSRTGDKHRERARQIGVNNYLGKPYQENDLLDSIQHIIGATESGAVA